MTWLTFSVSRGEWILRLGWQTEEEDAGGLTAAAVHRIGLSPPHLDEPFSLFLLVPVPVVLCSCF